MNSLRWSPVESKSYYELPWLLLVVFFYKKLEINKKTNKRNYRGYPKIIQIGSNKFKDILRKWHEKLSSIKQWIWEIPPFQITKKNICISQIFWVILDKKTFLKIAVIGKLGKSLVLLKGVTLSGILNNWKKRFFCRLKQVVKYYKWLRALI